MLVMLLVPVRAAWAQTAASAHLSSDVVEVGDAFTIDIHAEVADGPMPSDPRLDAPSAFTVSGPSQTRSGVKVQIGGGSAQQTRTFSARWYLVAQREGTFTITPPSVTVGGNVVRASGRLTVKVVPVGHGPQQRRPPSSASPFGGFGNFFNFGQRPSPFSDDSWDDEAADPAELEPRARELMMTKEPQEMVFLRMIADKDRAVVGEQITLSYYVYFRADMKLVDQREPALTGFLRHELDPEPGTADALITSVGRWRYHVKLLDRVAIFPLRAGKLDTGTLSAKFTSRRMGNTELTRESESLQIAVREPPSEGRPPGYRIGDVGRFRVSAEVSPRATRVGDSVSVVVRINGVGALPNQLTLPERTGIEWLAPDKKQEVTVRNGRVGGSEVFSYAVRFREPGDIQLGTIELSYWDPNDKRYVTASTDLGNVLVQEGDAKSDAEVAADEEGDEDAFATMAKPRMVLGNHQTRGDDDFDPRTLWALVLLPPFGVVVAQLGAGTLRSLRERRRQTKDSPLLLANKALDEAKTLPQIEDAAAAYERAIHLAIEAATTLKSRAVLRDALKAQLLDKGIDEALGDEVLAVLDECSRLRFDPAPDEGVADGLRQRATKTVRALLA
jgi:hypothetical protein